MVRRGSAADVGVQPRLAGRNLCEKIVESAMKYFDKVDKVAVIPDILIALKMRTLLLLSDSLRKRPLTLVCKYPTLAEGPLHL
jgi:hypothetical protein